MKYLFFYLPFGFTYHRGLNRLKVFVLFLTKAPIIWLLITLFDPDFNILRFIVSFFYLYTIYEFGYIQNDCETIKKEKEPTLRLKSDELDYYEKYKTVIYIWRVLLLIIVSSLLFVGLQVSIHLLLIPLMIIPVFYIYNIIRGWQNLYLHLLLMTLKHITVVFITLNMISLPALFWLFLFNPLPFFIELNVKGKCGYQNDLFKKLFIHTYDSHHIHLFRVYYQFFFLILSCVFVMIHFFPLYYLIANIFCLIVMILTYYKFGRNDKEIKI